MYETHTRKAESSIMGHQIKLFPAKSISHLGIIHVFTALFLPSCLVMCLGEAEDSTNVWAPAIPIGEPDAAGSWLQPGPSLGAAAIWGMNQQLEDVSLPLSVTQSSLL